MSRNAGSVSPSGDRYAGRRLGLQSLLVLAFVTLSALVVVVTSTFFVIRQRNAMNAEVATRRAALEDSLKRKGTALARSMALSSERALAMLDYLFLTEIIKTTTTKDPDFVYAIIMGVDGNAKVHSDQALAGQTLKGKEVAFALALDDVGSQTVQYQGAEVLEAVAPIRGDEKKWGVVRLGMSQAPLNALITEAQRKVEEQFWRNVVTIFIVASLLLAFSSFLGAVAARSLARPLRVLMSGVERIRQGQLGERVAVQGAREFGELGSLFNDMSNALQQRDAALRDNNEQLRLALHKAEEASRLKSEFLSNISHELRTPLNSIVNVPNALLKRYENEPVWECPRCKDMFAPEEGRMPIEGLVEMCPTCTTTELRPTMRVVCTGDPGEHRHFLTRLRQASQHLLSVVNDLLDFSKLEAGKMSLHKDHFELSPLFGEIYDTLAGLSAEKHITLDMRVALDDLAINADRVKLSQILINLLGNAIKFTPEGGHVRCEVGPRAGDHGSLHFVVSDTGPGIPQDHLETIFESFRQVDGSHTRAHNGTGLGLSITRQLVELHGGKIWCESEVGKGSAFHIMVPNGYATPADETRPQSNATPSPRRQLIMVVDDSAAQLDLAKLVLEEAGFLTTLVENPSEVYQRVLEHKPHAIVLDVMMPGESGLSILRRLKHDEATKTVPVFVSSAYSLAEEQVTALEGIWLPKPWDGRTLATALRRHLDGTTAPATPLLAPEAAQGSSDTKPVRSM